MTMKQWVKPKQIEDREHYKTNKEGVLVAFVTDDNLVRIGWSFCDLRADKFDKNRAEQMALGRALSNTFYEYPDIIESIPFKHREDFGRFVKRASRYYKGKKFPTWAFSLII